MQGIRRKRQLIFVGVVIREYRAETNFDKESKREKEKQKIQKELYKKKQEEAGELLRIRWSVVQSRAPAAKTHATALHLHAHSH